MIKLFIDPGHGADDNGAVARGDTEDEINLLIAQMLAKRIAGSGEPIEVKLSREFDYPKVPIASRALAAKEWGADFVLCLHCDAAERDCARGCHSFYRSGDKEGGLAYEVAAAIQRAMPVPLVRPKLGGGLSPTLATKQTGYPRVEWVLNHYDRPSCLVEMGFVTHPVDSVALRTPAVQSALVSAMMCGASRVRQLLEEKR